jgi:hypothetical protein
MLGDGLCTSAYWDVLCELSFVANDWLVSPGSGLLDKPTAAHVVSVIAESCHQRKSMSYNTSLTQRAPVCTLQHRAFRPKASHIVARSRPATSFMWGPLPLLRTRPQLHPVQLNTVHILPLTV